MDVAIFRSDLYAEDLRTSAEMSMVARLANASNLYGRKPANNLESPLGRPNTPSRQTHLVAAYTHHVTALSWASENFSWQQPAPPGCRILILVESSLFVRDCSFVRRNPAYFAANFYI